MSSRRRLELEYIDVDAISPNDFNPQEMDEDTFQRLIDEISEVGFIDPLAVVTLDDGSCRIIDGEHRWRVAKHLGLAQVPCIILHGEKWDAVDLQKFVCVRANVLRGKMNPDKFRVLYEDLAKKYGTAPLQHLMGFTDSAAFKKLTGELRSGMGKVLSGDLQKEFEDKAKKAKTAKDLSAIVSSLLKKHGETVNQSFMIFTYGTREHIYVAMDELMRRAMDNVINYCKTTGRDINEVMAPVIFSCVEEACSEIDVDELGEISPSNGKNSW